MVGGEELEGIRVEDSSWSLTPAGGSLYCHAPSSSPSQRDSAPADRGCGCGQGGAGGLFLDLLPQMRHIVGAVLEAAAARMGWEQEGRPGSDFARGGGCSAQIGRAGKGADGRIDSGLLSFQLLGYSFDMAGWLDALGLGTGLLRNQGQVRC